MPRSKPPQTSPGWSRRVTRVLAHRYFFIFVLVLFFLQMAWIALSAIYPMLFDEEYHLGIIDIYSRQLSPFIAIQPPEASFHGDITRYSSYFFHYLMSFPYRLVDMFTDDLITKVIAMRLVCISLVLVGFCLFRKVLLGFGVSRATTHSVLLVFSFIPIVPFALAQINYDSLQFLWVPLLIYLAQGASRRSSHQGWYTSLFIGVACLAIVTKFTALPIVLACTVFIAFYLWRHYRAKVLTTLWRQFRGLPRAKLIIASCLVVLGLGLAGERYGANLITYRAYEPSCDRLRSKEDCRQNNVFRRNDNRRSEQAAQPKELMNLPQYASLYWAPHIFGDFSVVAAFVYEDKADMQLRYLPTDMQASGGNRAFNYSARFIVVVSFLVLIVAAIRRQLSPSPLFALAFLVVIFYAGAHLLRGYADYVSLGSAVAAQGRYYIPLLILVLAAVAVALQHQLKSTRLKLVVLCLCLLPLTQGGGAANYMLYSNAKWYWPRHEKIIEKANLTARTVLRSFIPL